MEIGRMESADLQLCERRKGMRAPFFATLFPALLLAAGAEAVTLPLPELEPKSPLIELVQRRVCEWVKEDPRCWGDTCRMRQVCRIAPSPYRPGMSTTRTDPSCGPCSRSGRQVCRRGGRTIVRICR
jgi:hypothetical protein